MKICVLYGSVRDNRAGIRVAKFLIPKLEERGHEVQFMDAKELNLPLLNKRYMDYKGDAPEQLESIAEAYRQADAFLIVAGEYNFSIQPGLKNMLDYFYQEYFFKPVGFAIYSGGAFAGIRAFMQLVQTSSALSLTPIPSFFATPLINEAMAEDGTPADAKAHDRANKFLNQLEWYARALKAERDKGLPS